ncbi:MAG TPA: DUF3127 domain-containing protein [Bacteroidales bacterium]|nr:DUF3127 domain-containing protein [Bacteroidales bacterium]
MEITAKLIEKLQVLKGEGKNGNWVKASFIVETLDTYPKKLCFIAWNEKASIIDNVLENETIKIYFDIESREFNGKWYTDLKMWKIEKLSTNNLDNQNIALSADTTVTDAEIVSGEEVYSDDLPF